MFYLQLASTDDRGARSWIDISGPYSNETAALSAFDKLKDRVSGSIYRIVELKQQYIVEERRVTSARRTHPL